MGKYKKYINHTLFWRAWIAHLNKCVLLSLCTKKNSFISFIFPSYGTHKTNLDGVVDDSKFGLKNVGMGIHEY